MIKAIGVVAHPDFTISVHMEDGRTFKMDMSFIKGLSGPVVDPLKSYAEFSKAFVRNGIVTWTTGYDIDPYYLIEQGIAVEKTA